MVFAPLDTHPHIRFDDYCASRLDAPTLTDIDAAQEACRKVAALPTAALTKLTERAIVAAAHGSAAIENNPLSVTTCENMFRCSAPPDGTETQAVRELRNTLDGYVRLADRGPLPVTVETVCATNSGLLDGATHDPAITPGQIRDYPVRVGGYYPPQGQYCEPLLAELSRWLESSTWHASGAARFANGALCAIVAHLYVGWIHPFGDGNGRTSRLVEASLLIGRAGAPAPVAMAMSAFYWQNREAYYAAWRAADRSGTVTEFAAYAVNGLRVIAEDCASNAKNPRRFCNAVPRTRTLPPPTFEDRMRLLLGGAPAG